MTKLILACFLTLITGAAQALECAKNISELRALMPQTTLKTRWVETTESNASRVLTLILSDSGAAGMSLRLTLPNGTLWADFKGEICEGAGNGVYYAKVNKGASSFGPGAPSLVKLFGKPSRVNLNLANPERMKVQASKYKGTYRPL